jgi:hypothetical protein
VPYRYLSPKPLTPWFYGALALQTIASILMELTGQSARMAGLSIATSLLGVVFTITAFVLLLIWTHRSYGNLTAFGARQLRTTPGWAVAYHFIPLLNLYKPFSVCGEIARASDPKRETITQNDRRRARYVPAIMGWAIFYFAYNLIGGMATAAAMQGQNDPEASKVLLVLAPIENMFLFLVVWTITRRQDEKAVRLQVTQ